MKAFLWKKKLGGPGGTKNHVFYFIQNIVIRGEVGEDILERIHAVLPEKPINKPDNDWKP